MLPEIRQQDECDEPFHDGDLMVERIASCRGISVMNDREGQLVTHSPERAAKKRGVGKKAGPPFSSKQP